jgi:hypothetical protein
MHPTSHRCDRAQRILDAHGLPYFALETQWVTAPAALAFEGGVILLPSSGPALDDTAYEATILHEAAHLRSGNHLSIWVYGLAVASAWWNPLVHIARNLAEEAIEDACDDYTLQLQCSGLPLARSLVAFAEASCRPLHRPALNMITSKKLLDRRVRRLLQQGDNVMNPTRLAAVGAALLGVASISLAVSMTSSTSPSLAQAKFGLDKATQWTYRVTYADGHTEMVKKQTLGVERIQDQDVTEIRVTKGTEGSYEYLGANGSGLYSYQRAYLGDHAGIDLPLVSMPVLESGVKEGSSFSWTYLKPVQTNGRPVDPEKFRVMTTAEIVSMAKPLANTAGTFNTIVVKYNIRTSEGNSVSTSWISPEAGLIKQELSAGPIRKLELIEFASGGPIPSHHVKRFTGG